MRKPLGWVVSSLEPLRPMGQAHRGVQKGDDLLGGRRTHSKTCADLLIASMIYPLEPQLLPGSGIEQRVP